MADNAPPPVPNIRPAARNIPQPPRERNYFGLVLVLVFGYLLAQFYLYYVVPKFYVLTITYPQANFQNKTANYYDVLNISHNANATEIKLAYETQLTNLSPIEFNPDLYFFNMTVHAKINEVNKAFQILQSKSRCLYDFEFLGLGFWRYLRCWYNSNR
ncbi:hypothetical protein F4801DRAFT_580155 [Xylaria longipes]|nr:hypothetical protein F4801DRAFT_580155 [Xylaria longipes]